MMKDYIVASVMSIEGGGIFTFCDHFTRLNCVWPLT